MSGIFGTPNRQTVDDTVDMLQKDSAISFDMQVNHFRTDNAENESRITKDYVVKRSGNFSYKIDLLATDSSNENSKKSELVGMIGNDGKEIYERSGNISYYAFSFMVDNGWISPIGSAGNPNHATIMQFKTPDLPVIVFMIFGNDFMVRVNWAKAENPVGAFYQIAALKKGQWQDFLIKINFNRAGNVSVWDGQKQLLNQNVQTYIDTPMELHTGLYTPQDNINRTIHIGVLKRSSKPIAL